MSFKYYNFKLIGEGVFVGQVVTLRCFSCWRLINFNYLQNVFNFLSLCFTTIMIISLNIMITF